MKPFHNARNCTCIKSIWSLCYLIWNKLRAFTISHMECQLTHSCDSYGYLPSCDKHRGIEENQHSLCRWLTVANHSAEKPCGKGFFHLLQWCDQRTTFWSQSGPQLDFIPHRYRATGGDASCISTYSDNECCNSTQNSQLNTQHGLGVRVQYVFRYSWENKTQSFFEFILKNSETQHWLMGPKSCC